MVLTQRNASRVLCTTSLLAIALAATSPARAGQAQSTPPAPSTPSASDGIPLDRAVSPSSAAVEPKADVQAAGAGDDQRKTAASSSPGKSSGADAAADVIVVGTRASLRSAISRKRAAKTIVDSIVADDIASFPDKNVGDSLARITGVQLSRDFGEGTQVSIRGVEPDLNRVEINGVSQVSTQGSRAGDFRELATELVKSIDVYKGYEVDLTEGGIGGTVSIQTRKPLELLKPLVSLVLSEQHLETTKDWKPRISFVAGSPNIFRGFGALLNVTYDNVTTRQDYISNTNWSRLADFDHSDQKTVADPNYAAYNTYASCAGVGGTSAAAATTRRLACETQFFDWAPTVPRYRNWVRHDKRISGDLTLQYEVSPNFRAYAELTANHRDQTLQDANYSLDMARFQRYQLDPTLAAGLNGGTSRPQVLQSSATVDANHVVTSYTTALTASNIGSAAAPVYTGSANILQVQRRDYTDEQYSYYYQGGFEWNLGRLHMKALASHATARDIGNNALIQISTGIAGVTVDRNNALGIPAFIFPSTINPADYSIYTATSRAGTTLPTGASTQIGPQLSWRPNDYGNQENQFKLDETWDADIGPLKSIQFGGQYRAQSYLNYTGGGTNLINAATGQYQTSSYITDTTTIVPSTITARVTKTANGGSTGQTYTYQLTQAEYVALLNSAHSVIPGGAPLFYNLSGAPSNIPGSFAVPTFDYAALGQYYDLSGFNQSLEREADGLPQIPNVQIKEKISSAYFMLNLDTQLAGFHLTGNGGVRYTHTQDTGTGTNITKLVTLNAAGTATTTTTTVSEQLSLSHQYSDWLPAFNLSLEFTPNLVLRGNWARNLARPKPTDLVPNVTCTDDDTLSGQSACTAGNPNLVPYRADQWELNLAWYPNHDTLLSLGYYKKAEKSFVVQGVTSANVNLFNDGVLYTVKQPVNGFGALLDGIEASAQTVFTFLPGVLSGFGASGNVTFARAIRTNLTNIATGAALTEYPGLSKWTWNASIFYDKDWLNIRMNYNYRSDWLVTVADANNGNNPTYRKGEGYLDAKVTFRLPQWGNRTSMFMEMQNINKEYSQSYIKNLGPIDIYYPGQRFFAGFQVKM